ncbi:MAG: GNAT family N-acetyltransferase [Oscillospiraceae bacterium]|nr:GNAT family N-acetyltransferase [Oscillospiraceae bacterium]
MNTPELAAERLILREFTAGDLEAVYQIFSDAELNRFLPWFALKTRSDAEKFYQARLAGQYRRASGRSYAICLKDHVPIGYVNTAADDSHDLGYGLRKEFWRRGIVTEYTLWKRACEQGDRPPGLPV